MRYGLFAICLALTAASCSAASREPLRSGEERVYSHDGVKIHFQDIGRGRPLVFIHGFGASSDTWRFLVPALKDHYRLILVDLKGHGNSDRPDDNRYSPEEHAAIITGLMKQLNLSHTVLVGHSFGAAIALLTALNSRDISPSLISGVVLFGGSVDPHRLPLFLRVLRVPVVGWLSMKLTSASFRTRIGLRRAFYDDSKVTDSLVEQYASYLRIPGTDRALLETAKQFVPANLAMLKESLRTLDIPVVHFYGDQDIVIPREAAEEVCTLLPHCRAIKLAGVGHVPQEEKPDEVIPLLKAVLEEMSARSKAAK